MGASQMSISTLETNTPTEANQAYPTPMTNIPMTNTPMKDTQMKATRMNPHSEGTREGLVIPTKQNDCHVSNDYDFIVDERYDEEYNDVQQQEQEMPPSIHPPIYPSIPTIDYESEETLDDVEMMTHAQDDREIIGYMVMKSGDRIAIYKDEFEPVIYDDPDKSQETPRSESARENLCKTVSWNDEVLEDEIKEPMRQDPEDGLYYTRKQFYDYYGDDFMWDYAHPSRTLINYEIYEAFDYAHTHKLSDQSLALLIDKLLENAQTNYE